MGFNIINRWMKYCIVVAILAFTVSGAQAATLTVDDSGGADYTRIQDAINAANAGDTVQVQNGTYYENVNVTKQLTLRGIGMPVVDARGSGSVITLAVDRTVIEGFTVIRAGVAPNAGIKVTSSSNTLRSNMLGSNTVSGSYGYGIYLSSSSNNTLSSNMLSGNHSYDIYLYTSSNNMLSNNTLNGNSDSGIFISHSSNNNTLSGNNANSNSFGTNVINGILISFSSNNTLSSNYISRIQHNAGIRLINSSNNMITDNNASIAISESSNNMLIGNNASSNPYGRGIDISSNNTTLIGNSANSNYYSGIIISGYNNTLIDNYANSNNYDDGIGIGIALTGNNNTLIGNNANSNYDQGISIYNGNNNTFIGNNVNSNKYGIQMSSSNWNVFNYNNVTLNNDTGIYISGSSNNILYLNNLINNTKKNAYDYDGTNVWDNGTIGNYYSDYIGIDSNNDGIGDIAYSIPGGYSSADRCPLMRPYHSDITIVQEGEAGSITNLTSISYTKTYINWTWTDSTDIDFSSVNVWIDGIFKENISKGIQFYNATGFALNSEHTIATRTIYISGNTGQTWVNNTVTTNETVFTNISVKAPKLNSSFHKTGGLQYTLSSRTKLPITGSVVQINNTNTGNITEYTIPGPMSNSILFSPMNLSSGNYTARFRVSVAGGVSPWSVWSIPALLDNETPYISMLSPEFNISKKTLNVRVDAIDNSSGIKYIYVRVLDADSLNMTTMSFKKSKSFLTRPVSLKGKVLEGRYGHNLTISAYAEDKTKHIGQFTNTTYMFNDTYLPTIKVGKDGSGSTSTVWAYKATATDKESGINHVYFEAKNGTGAIVYSNVSTPVAGQKVTMFSFTVSHGQSYSVRAEAIDNFGNEKWTNWTKPAKSK